MLMLLEREKSHIYWKVFSLFLMVSTKLVLFLSKALPRGTLVYQLSVWSVLPLPSKSFMSIRIAFLARANPWLIVPTGLNLHIISISVLCTTFKCSDVVFLRLVRKILPKLEVAKKRNETFIYTYVLTRRKETIGTLKYIIWWIHLFRVLDALLYWLSTKFKSVISVELCSCHYILANSASSNICLTSTLPILVSIQIPFEEYFQEIVSSHNYRLNYNLHF